MFLLQTSFRMKLEVTEREPTGAMKTKKKPGEKAQAFSSGLFLLFSPDAKHPAGGVPPPSPWAAVPQPTRKVTMFLLQRGFCVARSAGTQFAKMQSSFAKGFLRGGSAAANSQSFNHPLRKCVCVFFCFTGKLFFDMNCLFRKKGAGMISLLVLPVQHKESGTLSGYRLIFLGN